MFGYFTFKKWVSPCRQKIILLYLHSGLKSIRSVIFGSKIGLPTGKWDSILFVSLCMSENIYGQDIKNGNLVKINLCCKSGKRAFLPSNRIFEGTTFL